MAFYSYLSTKIIIAFITKSYQDLFGVRSYINAIFLFVHEQEDSCTLPLATHKYCQVLFIFFFPGRLCRNSYCTFPDFQNRFV